MGDLRIEFGVFGNRGILETDPNGETEQQKVVRDNTNTGTEENVYVGHDNSGQSSESKDSDAGEKSS